MSKYVSGFIKDHKEYFLRNKKVISTNNWNDTDIYNDKVDEFANEVIDLKNSKKRDKDKILKEIQKEIKAFTDNYKKTKGALFKQETDLTSSILSRITSFIKECEKNGERQEDGVQNFIDETVEIIKIHIDKCNKYLNYNTNIITKSVKTEEEVDYQTYEIMFQDEIFQKKIKIQEELNKLNISGEVDNSSIEFHNKKKAGLILREPLTLLREDVKEITDKIPVNWDVRTSKEMFINMRPQDIPKWNNKKSYFEQDPVVLQFWTEEYNKVIHGVNLGGFYMHGWLYFHLNFFRTPIPQPDGREPNIQPPLRDNEWFFSENLKACESLDYPGYYSKAMLVYGTRRFAKALRNDQHLYYIDGSIRPIGGAKEGDIIFGSDGKPTKILGVYPQGKLPLYKVSFQDGRESICCDEHLWTVYDYQAKEYKVLPLKELIRKGLSFERTRKFKGVDFTSKMYNYSVPINKPIEYNFEKSLNLSIDPYFLGLWLGDGTSRTVTITTEDEEIKTYLKEFGKSQNLKIREELCNNNTVNIHLVKNKSEVNSVFNNLKDYKLIQNKHIPDEYKVASVKTRLALLQGLMDTDGTVGKGGSGISYSSASKILAYDVLELTRSLGINSRVEFFTGNYIKQNGEFNTYYKVTMFTDLPVFRLTRKLERLDGKNKNRRGKIERNQIVSISKIEDDFATCIRVDNESKEFITNDYTVTHNSVILASLAHWRTISKFNSFGTIIGGNSSDLNALTSKIKTSMTYIDKPMQLDIIKQEWDNGETTFGIKQDASNPIIFSTLIVQNLEQGTTKKTQKTAGMAPSVSIYDEIGKYDFLKPYLAALPSFKTPYGFKCVTCLAGTGGEASLSKDAMKVLSNPEVYDILPMNWDLLETNIDPEQITWKRKNFATFFPGQMAYEEGFIKERIPFKDFIKNTSEELNDIDIDVTNWKKNTEFLEKKVKDAQLSADSNLLVQQRRVQYPTEVDHCFLSSEKNPFCYQDALRHKELLESSGEWDARRELYRDEKGKVQSKLSTKPLIEYPFTGGGNMDAPFLIFEDIPEEKPHLYTYVCGLDDYKQTESNTDSVGCMYVYKYDLFGDKFAKRLVASYSARPEKHKDFHRNCLLLMEAYNAVCFMENEDTAFIEFLEEMHLEDKYLMRAIDFTSSLNITNNAPRKFGWSPKQSKQKLLNMFVNYCNQDILSINEDGEEIMVKGVTRIKDIHLLSEIINYKPDANCDRLISSLGAVGWLHYLETNFILPKTERKYRTEEEKPKEPKKVTHYRADRKRTFFNRR